MLLQVMVIFTFNEIEHHVVGNKAFKHEGNYTNIAIRHFNEESKIWKEISK